MQIYLIRHRDTGRGYVGQTIWNFNVRYKAGNWISLTHNRHLKACGKKYGRDAFDVSILWEGDCTREELDQLEDRFMQECGTLWPNGFNYKTAGKAGVFHRAYREYELIDSEGTLYHVTNLRQFCKHQGIDYGAILNMVSGLSMSSQGYALASTPLEQIVNPRETWEIVHVITGERKILTRADVPKEADALGMKTDLLWLVLRGKIRVSHGWKLGETILTVKRLANERLRVNGVELLHENGERAIVTNPCSFARHKGLDRKGIYSVIKGKNITSQGWRLATTLDVKAEKIKRRGREAEVVWTKTGERFRIKNVCEFCRQQGLNQNSFSAMLHGRSRCYRGWVIAPQAKQATV